MQNLAGQIVRDLPIVDSFLPTALTGVVTLVCGMLAIASNPRRHANIIILTISAHISLWLITREIALSTSRGWILSATFIGGWIPFHFWLLTTAMINEKITFHKVITEGKLWLSLSGFLGIITIARYFISSGFSIQFFNPDKIFYIYSVVLILMYLAVYIKTKEKAKLVTGIKTLELEIVAAGGSFCAISIIIMTVASFELKLRLNLQPIVIMLFYSVTVFSLTNYRILDTRQLLIFILTRLFSLCALTVLAYTVYLALINIRVQEGMAFSLAALIPVLSAMLAYKRLSTWFKLVPDSSAIISRITDLSRIEFQVEKLETGFKTILMEWLCTDHVLIWWIDSKDTTEAFSNSSSIVRSLKVMKWVTRERVIRERSSFDSELLTKFMDEQGLYFVSISEGTTHSLIIGSGQQRDCSLYTYPLIRQIMGVGSMIESYYERNYFLTKIRDTDRLATVGLVGASLAHEIRNPLVSIKTFIHLLERNEIADVKSRFIIEIKEELERIDRLTKQLIDLSRPRQFEFSRISLVSSIEHVVALLEPEIQLNNINVNIHPSAVDPKVWTDPEGCKQVIINLCRNSIQALSGHSGQKRIDFYFADSNSNIMLRICDSGPGIPEELAKTQFQPFRTTKTNGFGLGLAVCRDILSQLGGSIAVGERADTEGAVFDTYFPRNIPRSAVDS